MTISTAFKNGQEIPAAYTCMGENISPPLQLDQVPQNTRSMVLIFEDLDASPPWTHWLVFNIPAGCRRVNAGQIPPGGTEGLANNHSFGYEGPCPRYFKGTHHYRMTVFALNRMLDINTAYERTTIEKAMKAHLLDKAAITGLCTAS